MSSDSTNTVISRSMFNGRFSVTSAYLTWHTCATAFLTILILDQLLLSIILLVITSKKNNFLTCSTGKKIKYTYRMLWLPSAPIRNYIVLWYLLLFLLLIRTIMYNTRIIVVVIYIFTIIAKLKKKIIQFQWTKSHQLLLLICLHFYTVNNKCESSVHN